MTGREYLVAHGVDLEVAEDRGVEVGERTISYPYTRPDGSTYRRVRYLAGELAGKTIQPQGEKLGLYWPVGSPKGDRVLVCEGESDVLAVLSALRHSKQGDGAAAYARGRFDGLCAVPGVTFPSERLAAALRNAGVREAVLAFDGDDPGRSGTVKAIEALKAVGIVAVAARVPDGEDVSSVLAAADDRIGRLADLLPEDLQDAATEPDPASVDQGPPPDTAELLDATARFIQRFIVLPFDAALTLLVLFVAHTWTFDAAEASPYVLVISPEKRSGKTRLLEVLTLLVRRPWPTSGPSPTALYRTLADRQSCLLLDELDALLAGHGERTEGIREVLNAGNRPGFPVGRFNAARGEMEHFETFSPKVLAGIDTGHRIPDTVRDRGLTIHMQRKTGAEPVERLRLRKVRPEAEPLRQRFASWADAHLDGLRDAEPDLPPELNDRLADGAEPLLAIAELAAGGWPARARAAIGALADDDDDVALGAQLLAALRDAFGDTERLRTTELLDLVNAEETLPFGGFGDGGLDSRGLARLLKPYGIRPKSVRIGDDANHRGYERAQFRDAWKRWSPRAPEGPPQAPHPPHATPAATQEPLEQAVVADVADVADNPTPAPLVADNGCPSHPDGPVASCRYCRAAEEAAT